MVKDNSCTLSINCVGSQVAKAVWPDNGLDPAGRKK